MIHENIDSKIIVTDQEITDLYEARRKDYPASPDLVEVKAVFINLKDDATPTEITDLKLRALQIVEQVREGIDFDFLVEQYSDEPLKSHEGVLGKFTKGDLIAALDSAVFSMKVGEVSDPVWVSEGAYILKVIKKEDEQYKPVEEVRAELYNILYKQKRETVFLEWIKSLWERSSIIINRS
jgi:parvulin-like peptidyl-prolyl isomerase